MLNFGKIFSVEEKERISNEFGKIGLVYIFLNYKRINLNFIWINVLVVFENLIDYVWEINVV